MLVKRKIWLGLALTATGSVALAATSGAQRSSGGEEGAPASQAHGGETGEGGEGSAAYPGGGFESALGKVLAGEGGEGGAGLRKEGDTVSFPALNDEQIRRAIAGNTLRLEQHSAYHFDKSGTGQGWEMKWSQVETSKCGKGADPSYSLENGECWRSETLKLPAAKWTVRDKKLCTDPAVLPVTGPKACASVFLILNNVALFDGDKLIGKGNTLHAGRQLDAHPKE